MINFNYYGLSKSNYQRIESDIKSATCSMSKNTSRVFFLFMFVLFFVSLMGDDLEGIRYTYLSLAIAFLIIGICSFFKFFDKFSTWIMYFECALIYTFTILVAFSHPAVKSTQVFIFMILLPILFGDKFYRVIIMILTAMGVYLIVLFTCLDKSIWFTEALNAICLSVASIIIHFFINKDRCNSYLAKLERDDIIKIQKKTQEKLKVLSETDALTGVYNRRKLFEDLDNIVKNGMQKPIGIFMIDIDSFKQVNDTYGHIVGDSYLRQFGDILKNASQQYGLVVYRYGGDEFMSLIYPKEGIKMIDMAEEIRKEAKEIKVIKNLTVTISLGISNCEDNKGAPLAYDNWLIQADEAVYQAKKIGHDKVVIYQK